MVEGVTRVLELPPKIGRHVVLGYLATGGMAEIFLARVSGLPGFQKMVVIKRILPQLATKADFIEMFLDEARIAATLQHPNVVQMYDVGVVDGNYFIAMEYLHGEDVRSLMKTLYRNQDERLPLEHALNIIIGVSSGLHYAHEKVGFDGKPLDIIHRDVTPQNIIVTYEGGVKLLDFGIAKASNRFGETRFGTLKGKVPYMSPEQCRGESLDRRSDIFSLGIMLYELSLGRRLYRGASDFEILKQIVEGTVTPPHQIDPGYNLALEKIVMKALEKERDKRYQTARELQADLETLVREERMYVSPIALQQFMERVFEAKIQAWRDAQAHGQSLGEHLQHAPPLADAVDSLDPDELEEIDEDQATAEERAARERAALMRAIEGNTPVSSGSMPSVPGSHGSLGSLGSSPSNASLESLRSPARKRLPLLLAIGGVLTLGAVATLKLSHKAPANPASIAPPSAAKPIPEPVPVVTPLPPAAPRVAMALVKLKPTPPGATLYLDGKRLDGLSPLPLDEIAADAEHVLLVQLDGHNDALERFTLKPGEVRALDLKLVKPPAGKHASKLKVPRSATPPSAKPIALTPGPAVSKPEPPVKLEGEGTLVIASSPWCNVSIDGADKGPTPLSLKLPAGKHAVVLSNPEFKISRSLSVMILPNETLRKKLDFAQ